MEETIKAVIARGYATQEEHTTLSGLGFERIWSEDRDERLWCVVLDEQHFLFCNQPVFMRGPRSLNGMVGVYNRVDGELVMDRNASFQKFVAAGQAAIDYWNELKRQQQPQEE